jgi:polyvinyl alcohol dehydrogenase (cytochrome)
MYVRTQPLRTPAHILKKKWRFVLIALLLACSVAGTASVLLRHQTARAQAGDWPTYLANDGHTGFNSDETIINSSTVSNLKLSWMHKDKAGGKISTEPVAANGMLYWGSYDGLEHASRLTDGIDIWTTNLGQSTDCRHQTHGVLSTAAVASVTIAGVSKTVVYVGGGNTTLYALDANSGGILWQTSLGTPPNAFLYSSPTVFNGSVYIGVSGQADCSKIQGQMAQLEASTGTLQHVFNTVPNGCQGGSVWSSPTIDVQTGMLYVSTGERGKCTKKETMVDSLIALNAADLSFVGSWQIPSSEIILDGDFGSSPTLFTATINGTFHNMVGLANKNGIYYAFDRTNISASAKPLWQVRLASTPGPTISSSSWDGTSLYAAAGTTTLNGTSCAGTLSALDPTSGTPRWQDCLNFDAYGPVISVPGLVELAVGSSFIVVDATNGNQLFSFKDLPTNSNFLGPGSISNGVLYQGNMDGRMYAFAP